MVEGKKCVVAYCSKTFSPPQRNYCVTKRELLAVVMAANQIRSYLYGQEFELYQQNSLLFLKLNIEYLNLPHSLETLS